MSWFNRILSWLKGLFGPRRPMSALEAMDEIRRSDHPADAERWRVARASFVGRVFSEKDRARLWRRQRRHHPNAAAEWEPSRPTRDDLACLEGIVEDLAR